MHSVNKIILVGHVAADPELRETKHGLLAADFPVAVDRPRPGCEENSKRATDFFKVVALGQLAEVVRHYVRKGLPVFIEGRVSSRVFETPDGTRRWVTEILLESLSALASVDLDGPVERARRAQSAGSTSPPARSRAATRSPRR